MSVTIKDVASKLGVAPSTVSRVLNRKGNISEETQQRVYQAIREMNYLPNGLAQSFAKGRAGAVGLVVDATAVEDFSNAFFNRSVFAIETVAQQRGYCLMIHNGRDINGKQRADFILELMLKKKIDGLILPPSTVTASLIYLLKKNKLPFVILGQPPIGGRNCSWIDVDNQFGAQQAVEHLVFEGYKKIALVTDNYKAVFTQHRLAGYKAGLSAYGLAQSDAYVLKCQYSDFDCQDKVAAVFKGMNPPDAFICSNNTLAYHTLLTIKKRGLSIPEDVGVLTFDNYPMAEYMDPPLPCVDVDTFQLGKQAAETLFQKIEGKTDSDQRSLLGTHMIIRASTQRKKKGTDV